MPEDDSLGGDDVLLDQGHGASLEQGPGDKSSFLWKYFLTEVLRFGGRR